MSALQTVHVRVNDAATGKPTPCRVRITGPDGTYYAPLGRLTEFACDRGRDVGGNLRLVTEDSDKKYAYIDGTCEIQLPAVPIQVEVSKGFEYTPRIETYDLKPGQLSLRLAIERWYDARQEGWYSGDVRVEFMTPHAALLEAAAEDVAVVNLLARAIWALAEEEHPYLAYPNLLAFSGQRPALESPGHLVVVNTFNWHPRLGALLLLNCHRVVYPLSFGYYPEFDHWTLEDWCNQCHRKGGLVVGHDWNAAEVITGNVDAVFVEWSHFDDGAFVSHLTDLWNCGYRFPIVAGSWKGSNRVALGWARTYAQLGAGEEFTYRNWIEAVRRGCTFVSNGPLLFFTADGLSPGSVLELDGPEQSVQIRAEARSAFPISGLRFDLNDSTIAKVEAKDNVASFDGPVCLPTSGWLRARCLGKRYSAETSPVYVQVRGQPPPATPWTVDGHVRDLNRKLEWILTEARCEDERQRERLASMYERARQELLTRLAP